MSKLGKEKYRTLAYDFFYNKPIDGEAIIFTNDLEQAKKYAKVFSDAWCEDEKTKMNTEDGYIINPDSDKPLKHIFSFRNDSDFGSIILERSV